jgi:heme/copper-type cytochrome/quinol oxidase subunit 2
MNATEDKRVAKAQKICAIIAVLVNLVSIIGWLYFTSWYFQKLQLQLSNAKLVPNLTMLFISLQWIAIPIAILSLVATFLMFSGSQLNRMYACVATVAMFGLLLIYTSVFAASWILFLQLPK